MITIGLTGMSGSGKTYISNRLLSWGIPVVNTDLLVHQLYAERNACTEALKNLFGEGILNSDHSINRRILASIVFSDPQKLAVLNQTVHPFVISLVKKQIAEWEEKGNTVTVVEAPQLFEAHMENDFDYIISVVADHSTRVSRIALRDALTEEQAIKRLANQHSDEFFEIHSDFIIDNSDGADPITQLQEILHTIGIQL